MIPRTLSRKLRAAARKFPVVTVTGPRQSGKTTLVRAEFADLPYVSLELPDERAFALEDPRGFLARFGGPVVLDEVQRAPDLFSYIQVLADERDRPGQFILTGSQNFLLLERIAQSLAGRCAILHLLPLSLGEIERRPSAMAEKLGRWSPPRGRRPRSDLFETLFTGFYPRIHDKSLDPREWYAGYTQTYLERDVRQILNVGDLEAFGRFLRLCAGRSAQLLNLSGLASDCGVTHTTARRWLSVLEASFVVILLRPHHRSFGKRLVKAPKLHFLDTGLLCYLLGVRAPEDLPHHASRGAIFESFVVSEVAKSFENRGERAPLFFWRDSTGKEIDLLVDLGERLIPIEVKSSQTVASDFLDGLRLWRKMRKDSEAPAALLYGGEEFFRREGVAVYPWRVL